MGRRRVRGAQVWRSGANAVNFRSVGDLNDSIVRHLPKVPRDVDLIVGVPRSGLLAANLLALHLNLPLTDVEGLVEGRILRSGGRLRADREGRTLDPTRKVLVLDDSLDSGRSMQRAKDRIFESGVKGDFIFAAVYVSASGRDKVDFYFEEIVGPRVFGWNFMHHGVLSESCVDIDGVLCVDPTQAENDDGPRYAHFLSNAEPLWLPTVEVGWLVTCRLEKYRALTEQWLERHGVKYRHLVMMDHPNKEARLAAGNHGEYKADAYRSAGARLFIESSHRQALEIASRSGRPVLSVEMQEMVYPSSIASTPRLARRLPSALGRRARGLAGRLKRRLLHFDPPA
jgi:uncharacterized HAD superfamily protein